MMELSAHLVDSVIPLVPVRQWVLTLPYPLRYALAWNHERTRAVLAVFNRALEGFDLHAGVSVRAEDRDRLERLCRYVLRPPVVQDRLELLEDGRVLMELKQPFWDGTSHILFEPLEFTERLAVVIPRPRVNQLIYHGVLGPNAGWRREVVAFGREIPSPDVSDEEVVNEEELAHDAERDIDPPAPRRRSYTWAELMARAFLIDVLECPRCSARMKLIALVEEPSVVRKILDHLGLPTTIPCPSPARSPPCMDDVESYFVDSWS